MKEKSSSGLILIIVAIIACILLLSGVFGSPITQSTNAKLSVTSQNAVSIVYDKYHNAIENNSNLIIGNTYSLEIMLPSEDYELKSVMYNNVDVLPLVEEYKYSFEVTENVTINVVADKIVYTLSTSGLINTNIVVYDSENHVVTDNKLNYGELYKIKAIPYENANLLSMKINDNVVITTDSSLFRVYSDVNVEAVSAYKFDIVSESLGFGYESSSLVKDHRGQEYPNYFYSLGEALNLTVYNSFSDYVNVTDITQNGSSLGFSTNLAGTEYSVSFVPNVGDTIEIVSSGSITNVVNILFESPTMFNPALGYSELVVRNSETGKIIPLKPQYDVSTNLYYCQIPAGFTYDIYYLIEGVSSENWGIGWFLSWNNLFICVNTSNPYNVDYMQYDYSGKGSVTVTPYMDFRVWPLTVHNSSEQYGKYIVLGSEDNQQIGTYEFTVEGVPSATGVKLKDPDILKPVVNITPSAPTEVGIVGSQAVVDVQPIDGYYVESIIYNGQPVQNGDIVTITQDFELVVNIMPNSYGLTLGGNVVVLDENMQEVSAVTYDKQYYIMANVDSGYNLTSLTLNGSEVSNGGLYACKGAWEVNAIFEQVSTSETTQDVTSYIEVDFFYIGDTSGMIYDSNMGFYNDGLVVGQAYYIVPNVPADFVGDVMVTHNGLQLEYGDLGYAFTASETNHIEVILYQAVQYTQDLTYSFDTEKMSGFTIVDESFNTMYDTDMGFYDVNGLVVGQTYFINVNAGAYFSGYEVVCHNGVQLDQSANGYYFTAEYSNNIEISFNMPDSVVLGIGSCDIVHEDSHVSDQGGILVPDPNMYGFSVLKNDEIIYVSSQSVSELEFTSSDNYSIKPDWTCDCACTNITVNGVSLGSVERGQALDIPYEFLVVASSFDVVLTFEPVA